MLPAVKLHPGCDVIHAAVVFDCDGVLADSERLMVDVWAVVLARHGYTPTAQDVVDGMGLTDEDCHAMLSERADLPPWPVFERETRQLVERRYPAELRPFPDTNDAVRMLAMHGVPMAVASSSPRWRLDLTLGQLDLRRYFDATVAGDDSGPDGPLRGKPAPDLYAEACRQIRADPGRSLAVEDSAKGAVAAEAAGLRVIVVARPGAPLVPGHASVTEVNAELIMTWLGLR